MTYRWQSLPPSARVCLVAFCRASVLIICHLFWHSFSVLGISDTAATSSLMAVQTSVLDFFEQTTSEKLLLSTCEYVLKHWAWWNVLSGVQFAFLTRFFDKTSSVAIKDIITSYILGSHSARSNLAPTVCCCFDMTTTVVNRYLSIIFFKMSRWLLKTRVGDFFYFFF